MPLADASELVNRKNCKPLPWLALSLVFLGAALPARGECVSPSAAAEATTTTIYRCPEEVLPAAPQPGVVDPNNSTVVERGATDVPWFEPKPTRTSDPLTIPKTVSEPKPAEGVARTEPPAVKPPETAVAKPANSPPAPPPAQAEAPEKVPLPAVGEPIPSMATQEKPAGTEAAVPAAEPEADGKAP